MIRVLHSIATKLTTMSERVAMDTNIILYALNEADPIKKGVGLDIIRNYPLLPSQCFTEAINVCRRKWKYDKSKQIGIAEFLIENCQLESVSNTIVRLAHHLIARYDFQYFDSLVVATALQTNCTILYSEDMHEGLVVERQLQIANPFSKKK